MMLVLFSLCLFKAKESSKLRMKGMKLIQKNYQIIENIRGQTMKINTLWQIWKKGINEKINLRDLNLLIYLQKITEKKAYVIKIK